MSSHNSILIDISAIIDKETTLTKYIIDTADFKEDNDFKEALNRINKDMLFTRIYNAKGLLREIFASPKYADIYIFLQDIDKLFAKEEEKILDDKYVSFTAVKNLVYAYEKTGNGVVKTTLRCDTSEEYAFLRRHFPSANIIKTPIKEVVMQDMYGRIISGDFRNLLEVNYGGPKSIVILNYRENFTDDDMTMLRPELVINLGDIHDIKVMNAYAFKDLPNEEPKG